MVPAGMDQAKALAGRLDVRGALKHLTDAKAFTGGKVNAKNYADSLAATARGESTPTHKTEASIPGRLGLCASIQSQPGIGRNGRTRAS